MHQWSTFHSYLTIPESTSPRSSEMTSTPWFSYLGSTEMTFFQPWQRDIHGKGTGYAEDLPGIVQTNPWTPLVIDQKGGPPMGFVWKLWFSIKNVGECWDFSWFFRIFPYVGKWWEDNHHIFQEDKNTILAIGITPTYYIWLVVSNIFYFQFHIWDVILPIDELIFFKIVKTTDILYMTYRSKM